tara:strand:- start:265 stop:462 length:198 start_codon:yes stop_codon:yes gene_type:complete
MSKKNTVKSFEDLFEQLEGIVKKMDTGDIELEESLTLFEKGMSIVEEGKKKLDEAELKIKKLTHK